MNSLFQMICRIGTFMICAQAIVHFRPEESYEKYLKLLVSAMVLIQLFLPLGRFLFLGGSEELAIQSEAFLNRLEAEIAAAEKEAYDTDALLEQMTLEEVRRRMEEARTAQESGALTGTDAGNGITGFGSVQEGMSGTQETESGTPEPGAWNFQETESGTPEPGAWNFQETESGTPEPGAWNFQETESGTPEPDIRNYRGAEAADYREPEDDTGTVRIDRIQVDEIRVRLTEDSP